MKSRSAAILAILILVMSGSLFATPKHGRWVPIGRSIFPNGTTRILAGAGETVFFLTAKDGIYISTDAGLSWQTMNSGLPSLNISGVWYSPNDRLIAETDSGWFSEIAGSSWTALPDPDTAMHSGPPVAVAFDSHGAPYFASDVQGIFRLNADNTFTRVLDGRLLPPLSDFCFDSADRIIAIIGYNNLYRFNTDFTLDRIWKHVFGQLLKLPSGGNMIAGDSIWILRSNTMSAFATTHTPPYIVDSLGILYDLPGTDRSMDNGRSWKSYNNELPVGTASLFTGTSYGIIANAIQTPSTFTSRDSGSTYQQSIQLSNQLTFYSIFTDKSGRVHAFDSLGEHWTSDDRGETWGRIPSVPYVAPFLGQDGRYYVMAYNQNTNVWMSDDAGLTYHKPPHPNVRDSTYFEFFAVENGNFFSCSDSGKLYKSTDEGSTWKQIWQFPNWQMNRTNCNGVVERGQDLWAITQAAIHYSSNDGTTWTWSSDQTGRGNYSKLLPGRGRTVFVYMNNLGYEWLATSESPSYATWIEAAGPLVETSDSDAIAYHPYVSNPFYRDVLIHQTHDLTELDTLLDGPDTLSIQDMTLDSAGDLLGIGYPSRYINLNSSYLRGIYKFYAEGASVAGTSELGAQRVWVTSDGRSITTHSDAPYSHIKLFDILGRTRVSEDVEFKKEFTLPARELTSGSYWIAVRTQSGELATKILFVR